MWNWRGWWKSAQAVVWPARTQVEPSGAFEFRDLPRGSYRITAYEQEPVRVGSAMVELSTKDVSDVGIVLAPGPEVKGRVMVGRYWVEPYRGFPDEAYFESVRSGETDVFRDGFTILESGTGSIEIKVVFDAGKVTGTVSDKDGQVVGGAVVALAPAERRRSDRYRDVVADQYGHFEIKGVPPGDYKVFAWEDVEPGAWFSAEFLRTCEVQGTAVTVAAKQAAAVKVGLIR